MHVSVVGAGALGSVYGARLNALSGVDVSFVVRTLRNDPIVLQRIDGDRSELHVSAPDFRTTLPPEADVILLCVSTNDLDVGSPLSESLERHAAPIVSLTPLLPRTYERLRARFGKRLLAGMPSVASYRNERGVVRYWLPRVAQTLVDEPRPLLPEVDAFVRHLLDAGIPARLQIGTHEINAATTVSFLPIAFAIDVGGSVDALMADRELVRLALAGAREGEMLGQRLGKPTSWAELLARFVGPTMLKLGVSLAKKRSPEAIFYVEQHFGAKMHAQNVAMAKDIADLAIERGTPHAALVRLAELLERKAAA